MIKHLNDRRLPDRASLEIFHSILSSKRDRLDLRDKVSPERWLSFLYHGLLLGLSKVYHVSDQNFDRYLALIALLNPLLHFFEALAFGDIEHEENGSRTNGVFVDVFVMALLAWHVEVYNFVLVSVVDVVGRLEMELGRFFVFHNGP